MGATAKSTLSILLWALARTGRANARAAWGGGINSIQSNPIDSQMDGNANRRILTILFMFTWIHASNLPYVAYTHLHAI